MGDSRRFRRNPWMRALARALPGAGLFPALALANPSGGVVVAGSVNISAPNATTVQVDQASSQAVINWQSFSIGAGEFVQFNQPDSSAVVLNRVVGGMASEILGQMTANGRVFLVNPQGVMFGAGAQVDVSGIVVSTLDISDSDFLAGEYFLNSGQGAGTVSNAGSIVASDFGFVVLAGERVESSGLISARFGEVLLASGSELTLSLDQDGLVGYSIDAAALSQAAGVDLGGEILAAGGRVILAARAADDLARVAVNLEGRISAQSLQEQDGTVMLVAEGGSIALGGEIVTTALDATASGSIVPAGTAGVMIQAEDFAGLQAGAQIRLSGGSIQVGGDFSASAGSHIELPSIAAATGIDINTSTDVSTGDLSAERIFVFAGGVATTGGLEVVNSDGSAGLAVIGLFGVRVEGDVTVRGTVGDFTGLGSSSDEVIGASVRLGASSGGVAITGDLTVEGSVGQTVTSGRAFVRGADVTLEAFFGDVSVGGAISVDGAAGDARTGFLSTVDGGHLTLFAHHGAVSVGDTIHLSGTLGVVDGASSLSIAAAGMELKAGGPLSVGGDIDVIGTGGDIEGFGGFTAAGAYVLMESLGEFTGRATLQGINVNGSLASVTGSGGVFASGATLNISPDEDLRVNGDVTVFGRIGTARLGDFGGVVGADLLLTSFFGEQRLDGALTVNGSIDFLNIGSSGFANGALATLVGIGQGSDNARSSIRVHGPVDVDGVLGRVVATDFVEFGGATLWLDSNRGNVSLDNAVTLDGTIGRATVGREVQLNGASLYANSAIGTVTVHGIDAHGTVERVNGVAAVNASGADVILQARFPGIEGDLAALRLLGTIRQSGTVGNFSQLDTESGGGAYLGGVLADSGLSAIRFRNIEADNIYLYFDSDSQIGSATLRARQYLEIFTASLGPVLSGNALHIEAPQVFLSADMNLGSLSVEATEGLTVYFAKLHADQVDLHSGGDVVLQGIDPQFTSEPDPDLRAEVAGDEVRISAESVFGDARATIVAGGLDVRATDTILLEGLVQVGSGNAGFAGDRLMLARLALEAPDLVPSSAGPNAYFAAPTVALAQLQSSGDWLHIESTFTSLGQVQLQPLTLVQLAPLVDLPFFAEAVDVDEAGLSSVEDRIRTDGDNLVVPSFGAFSDVRGQSVIGARPQLGSDLAIQGSELDFQLGAPRTFGELILDTGLGGSTIVIGASDFDAGIQLSDRFIVDVRPSQTNFAVLTSRGILGLDRIATNGRVILLGGTLIDSRDQFYEMVAEEIIAYAAKNATITFDEAGNLVETEEDADEPLQCR